MLESIILWIIFNNLAGNPSLETAWGFAAWIETDSATTLFDTGADGEILLANIVKLGLNPADVDAIVISHPHWDHYGGLCSFLNESSNEIPVYIPTSSIKVLSDEFKQANMKPVDSPLEILPNVFIIGEFIGTYSGSSIPEQALVARHDSGLVVVVGCSHPGIVSMIEKITKIFPDEKIILLTGGFHLRSHTSEQIEMIADSLVQLGVEKIAPSHCTGDNAIRIFRNRWGDNFIDLSLGAKFVLREE